MKRESRPRHSPRRILGAFTLLEVMVAVAILAVALTSIFASEVGAIRVATRARFMTTATLLARCKMAEIEEQTMREGLPAVSANGSDHCCEEGETEGFECDWEIGRIVLPDQAQVGEEEAATGIAGALGVGGEGGEGEAAPVAPSIDQVMSGAMMGGGGDPIAELAMQYAFPVLKPQIEEQVRRATVTVRWHEGTEERSFDVVQYLVAQQLPAAVTQQAADQALGTGDPPPGSTPPGGTPPPGTQR